MQTKQICCALLLLPFLLTGIAAAQTMHDPAMHHAEHHPYQHHNGNSKIPTEAGQDAFGTIQEIVALLDADPDTDWSKVDIDALREHLVDMNELVLHSQASVKNIENGVEIAVTASGRALQAVQSMVPAHAAQLNQFAGWQAQGVATDEGAQLSVTVADPSKLARIRALGFYGLMALGAHHQIHHLAIAKGEKVH